MPERIRIRIIIITILSVCYFTTAIAQDPVKIKRLAEPVTFDGNPFEKAWSTVVMYPLTGHRPNYGKDPSEKTEVMVGYDDTYLWIGARLFMNDATKIFAVTKKRDDMLFDLDAFGIMLDTYNDNENGLAFYTAPTGLRTDYAISKDGAMGSGGPDENMNFSWNTFWDVITTRDDKGWYVEMRIPFSSIKFKTVNDIATMGMTIVRNISAHNETDTYPSIDPKYGFMATNKPSKSMKISIEGARPKRPVYVSPYILGGFSREYSLNSDQTKYVSNDKPELNAGLDVKYNINSNLTLDLTANTDFAQVEADDQQVNLTRFSLFFPEKRMFFQERSSLFSYSLGGDFDNLFYSRNIGIADQTPIRIYGGARLTGRVGRWDLGVIDMQTEKYHETPGENFGVLRLRRQVINPNSYIGAILTSRLGADGSSNIAYGVDGIFRLFGDDYLNLKLSQTFDSKLANRVAGLDPSFLLFNWERRSEKGFAYNFKYTYTGEQFSPGVGFLQRDSVHGLSARILYGWLPEGEKSKLFSYNISLRAEQFSKITDFRLESRLLSPGFQLDTKKGYHFEFAVEYLEEGVVEPFNLSDSVSITAGDYKYANLQTMIVTPQSKKVSVMGNINTGQFYDGYRLGLRPMVNFSFSSSFKLQVGYEFEALRFPERATNNSLNINSVNAKAVYMFSTKLSATIFVQYTNTLDEMVGNFRLRYNPREGNDFYIVFNDYRSLNRNDKTPTLPSYFDRTIMVKYTHTFIF
jgi:hypothetical protein